MQTIPKSAILWQEKLFLLSTCVFRGQNSVLCILLRGFCAQFSIWGGLGLTGVFSLCMAGITVPKLESHQYRCQSSRRPLLRWGCPLTLLKSMDKLSPGRLASSTDEFLSILSGRWHSKASSCCQKPRINSSKGDANCPRSSGTDLATLLTTSLTSSSENE